MEIKNIDSEPQQPRKVGNSYYFKIKPSKIQEKIIDPEKTYQVFAEEISSSTGNTPSQVS